MRMHPARRTPWRAAVGALAALLACGPLAAPAAAAEGRGEDAWWYKSLKIAEAHETSTGKGVTIAIVDSAVDPTVPELKGQDVVPVTNVCGGKAKSTGEGASHGSTMAAFIVGSGKGTLPDGTGMAGIAPDATVRVYVDDADGATPGVQCSGGADAAIAVAIDRAVEDGVDIISYSGGGVGSVSETVAAVQRALDAGVVVVGAAGQSPDFSTVIYPAAVPGVVAVTAVNRQADPWEQNVSGNREALVIAAPGVDMPTSGFDGDRWRSDGTSSGTSDATAIVSGGLALVMAEYPEATGNQVIQHLIHLTGGEDDFDKDLETGYGIMSVTRMLAEDPAQWPDVNPLLPEAAPNGAAAGASGAGNDGAADAQPVAAGAEDSGGVPAWVWALAVVALLIVVGGAVAALRMAKRPAGAGSPTPRQEVSS